MAGLGRDDPLRGLRYRADDDRERIAEKLDIAIYIIEDRAREVGYWGGRGQPRAMPVCVLTGSVASQRIGRPTPGVPEPAGAAGHAGDMPTTATPLPAKRSLRSRMLSLEEDDAARRRGRGSLGPGLGASAGDDDAAAAAAAAGEGGPDPRTPAARTLPVPAATRLAAPVASGGLHSDRQRAPAATPAGQGRGARVGLSGMHANTMEDDGGGRWDTKMEDTIIGVWYI